MAGFRGHRPAEQSWQAGTISPYGTREAATPAERTAIDNTIIPGFQRSIGKASIVSELVDSGFGQEAATELVERYDNEVRIPQRMGRNWRVDCPHCNKSMYPNRGIRFSWLKFMFWGGLLYLVDYFAFKRHERKGGLCKNCGKQLPANLLQQQWFAR